MAFLKKRLWILPLTAAGMAYTHCILPETFLVPYKRAFIECQDEKGPIPLSEDIIKLRDEVMEAINWKTAKKKKIQFCFSDDFEPVNQGHVTGIYGALVGIPYYLKIKSLEDIKKHVVFLETMQMFSREKKLKVNWDSKDGEHLADSYVLSDSAKKFLIAREIFYCDNSKGHVQGCVSLLSIGASLGTFMMAARNIGLHKAEKTVLIIALTAIGFFLYFSFTDSYNCKRDITVDEKAARLGIEYGKGGVEYYTKVLQRNVSARNIGSGLNYYLPNGNFNQGVIRNPQTQLTVRRQNITKMLKEMKEQNEPLHV